MITLDDGVMLGGGGDVDVRHGQINVDGSTQRQRYQLLGQIDNCRQDFLNQVQHLNSSLQEEGSLQQ